MIPTSWPSITKTRISKLFSLSFAIQLLLFGSAHGTDRLNYSDEGLRSPLLPLAIAPTGEYGGVATGEFDRRTISGELIYVRRACIAMGYSLSPTLSIWGEGGVAAIQLHINSREPRGAYGPAVGFGGVWTLPQITWREMTPFIYGRMTYFQSKLTDDALSGGSLRSRRSRFEWNEGTMCLGVSKPLAIGDPETSLVFGGFAFRLLSQDERRTVRSGASYQKSQYHYSSGFRPGALVGFQRQFPMRITCRLNAEVYPEGGRLTLAIGQWGAP